MAKTKTTKFSDEDISKAIYHHARHGRPELSNKIRYHLEREEEIPAELLNISGVKSEKPVTEVLDIPARNDRTDVWKKFAAKVSDFDAAVLNKMGRDEIIEILEQREIIPTMEEQQKIEEEQKEKEQAEKKAEEQAKKEAEEQAKSETDSKSESESKKEKE